MDVRHRCRELSCSQTERMTEWKTERTITLLRQPWPSNKYGDRHKPFAEVAKQKDRKPKSIVRPLSLGGAINWIDRIEIHTPLQMAVASRDIALGNDTLWSVIDVNSSSSSSPSNGGCNMTTTNWLYSLSPIVWDMQINIQLSLPRLQNFKIHLFVTDFHIIS